MLRTMNEPRLNLCPAASNGSSAASNEACGKAVAQRDQGVVGIVIDQEDIAGAFHSAGRGAPGLPRASWAHPALSHRSRAPLARCPVRRRSSRYRRRCLSADRWRPSIDNPAAHRRCGCRADPCARRNCRRGRCAARAWVFPAASCSPDRELRACSRRRRVRGLLRGRFLGRHQDGERRAGARNFAALLLQHAQQIGLRAGPRIVGRKDIGGRSLGARLLDGALGFQIEIVQEQLVIGREISQRGQHAGLFVVVVVRAATIWPWAAADSACTRCARIRWAAGCALRYRRRRCRRSRTAG